MKPGDRVTGEPIAPDMRAEHPTVTGIYEVREWSLGDETDQIPGINVNGISVDCDDIRPANRREKDTVL